jgi:hypothetical protein
MDFKNYAVIAAGLLILAGCSSYYQITNAQSGEVYYSKRVDDRRGGAVQFQDAQTGGSITFQYSEILRISKDSFKEGVARRSADTAPAADSPAADAPAQ